MTQGAAPEREMASHRLAKERLGVTSSKNDSLSSGKRDQGNNLDDEMVSDNFEDNSEDDLIIQCNIVSILPKVYDCIYEISETKDEGIIDEAGDQNPLCYYVMGNGVIE